MGFGGISIWQLLIILLIVVMLFGTKKLRGMGSDLGSAVKGFKNALNSEDDKDEPADGEKKNLDESQKSQEQHSLDHDKSRH